MYDAICHCGEPGEDLRVVAGYDVFFIGNHGCHSLHGFYITGRVKRAALGRRGQVFETIVDPDIVRGQNDVVPAGLHQYILRIEGMS